jgi:hypothetical protein
LSASLISTRSLASAFRFLSPSHCTLLELIDLFQFEVFEFGIDFALVCLFLNIPVELESREHHWVGSSALHSIFIFAKGDFFSSDFGLLVQATLDSLIAHYDFPVHDLIGLETLALLLSFVIHIYSEQSASLLLLVCQDFATRGRPTSSDPIFRAVFDRV